jgi:predicted nucleic acid-binding protein
MSARIYLDTSAYAALLFKEPAGETVRELVEDAEIVSSVLLLAEAWRAVVRLSRQGELDPDEYLHVSQRIVADIDLFALREVTLDLCMSTAIPTVTTPRTLDLIHLRTALWFHARAPLSAFLSLDAQQNRAARELGLPLPPLPANR